MNINPGEGDEPTQEGSASGRYSDELIEAVWKAVQIKHLTDDPDFFMTVHDFLTGSLSPEAAEEMWEAMNDVGGGMRKEATALASFLLTGLPEDMPEAPTLTTEERTHVNQVLQKLLERPLMGL